MTINVSVNGNKVKVSTGDAAKLAADQVTATNAGANPIAGITLQQALNYLDNNVTTAAAAIVYLKHLTKFVFLLAGRLLIAENRIAAMQKQIEELKG
jgi:hypothetical protein